MTHLRHEHPKLAAIFAASLLAALAAATTNAESLALPRHLADCLEAAPVVSLEGLPSISLDGGEDLLVRQGPHAYTPVAASTGEGGFVIAGATGTDFDRNIVVAALDGERGVTFATVIGGRGDDVATSIAVAADGTLIVAGSTTSADLVDGERPAEGGSGFVTFVDPVRGQVTSSTIVPYSGTIDDVAVSRDGTILFGGVAVGRPPIGDLTTVTTVFPPATDGRTQTYVAGTLTDAGPVVHATIEAAPFARVRVWYDCFGNPVIGIPPVQAAGCDDAPDHVYTMSHIDGDYDIDHDWANPPFPTGDPYPPGGLGYHALRWKYYYANGKLEAGDPPIELDWNLGPAMGDAGAVPTGGVWCGQDDILNDLENDVLFTQAGELINPRGTWECDTHWHGQVLALRAAYYATRWGSPTYADLADNDDSDIEVAIEETTFRAFCAENAPYDGEGLEDICNLEATTPDDLDCQVSDQGVATPNFYLRATKFSTSKWKNLVWYLRPSIFTFDTTLVTSVSGDHVFDPPPGDPQGLAVIQAATEYMLPLMVEEVDLEIATYQGGVLVARQGARGLVTVASLR